MHHSFAAIVTQSEAKPERTTLPSVERQCDGGDDLILDQLVTVDDAPQLRGDRHTVRGAARAGYSPRRQSDGGDDFILDQLVTVDDAPQLRGDRHTVRGAARAADSPPVRRARATAATTSCLITL